MEVEIITTETIKPSSPTPLHLKTYSLSIFDLLSPTTYMPLLMFYSSNNRDIDSVERSNTLKKSLSEALTRFYIFAGKIERFGSIHCNDDGADFIEARTNSLLSDLLNPPNLELLNLFLPDEKDTGRLLRVQATYFKCGGMSIGLRLSHKIADAWSYIVFVKSWSDAAHGTRISEPPLFIDASVLPPVDFAGTTSAVELPTRKCVTTRLVFDKSNIVDLKRKCVSVNVPQPTRVEAATALIWKCAMMSSSRTNSSLRKPSVLCHALNLRKQIDPPLPDNSIGNLGSFFTAQTIDKDVALHDLVDKLRSGIKEFSEYGVKKLQESGFSTIYEGAEEFGAMWTREDINIYICSSCCRFDMYVADFGWGKPAWVSLANSISSNTVIMMDTRDGEGIEAWLTLSEEEMVVFERNEELLEFASLNPSILISPLGSCTTRISSRM